MHQEEESAIGCRIHFLEGPQKLAPGLSYHVSYPLAHTRIV